ncbi:MAG: NapC/NirT family cytochrome c [Marinilabiliaceae bacterium]|jgi:nitrate/TMAO reductase-like tetraheme cytochrome c subunit|nr:NapC/NirT family cytochrome c [Marinilabiliaceae bacterium]
MKLPSSFYNPASLLGSILASISLLIIIFFLVGTSLFDIGGSYVGLIIFIILPVFLIIGLILIPFGMLRRSRKIKREGDAAIKKGIKLDLNDKRHWNAIALFVFVTFLFLFLTAIGSYEAFHYTESNEFCGTLCHKVMEPEWVAYQESTHSRVNCVECHVGTGANWYVRSKLSGLYQVYSVIFKKYPQPIPTPIHNLRPARETCEKCHWPGKFYSYRLRNEKHFLADSDNTEWNIQLKMKIGPEYSSQGLSEGIHWHINPDIKVEYRASAENREFIPWVRYINTSKGDTVIYTDIMDPIDNNALDTLEVRTMDCIDCHNRPSHHYLAPQEFTDLLMASGEIPSDLPEVKALAMEVFNNSFDFKDSAMIAIGRRITEFYQAEYPDILKQKPELIDRAKAGFLRGFSKNIFPEMKASWDVYPNHIGHVEFNGCFRCHNGNHESSAGDIISRDCNLCHTILGQGTLDEYQATSVNMSLEFRHPVDIGESWKEYTCTDCHRYLY